MAKNSSVILQARGLQTSNNELTSEDGALIEAKNVIIKRNNLIEQRRGFKIWGNALDLNSARVKQLTTYRNRLIRHYSNKLQFDSTGTGNFETFTGSFLEAQTGLRMKFIESNGNFYFTTEEGIKKISAPNADSLSTDSGYITSAGAIKAIDLAGEIVYVPESQSDFLVQDGAVAYRAVWGYKDANNNLVLGAPSQRVVVNNPMIDLLMRDYMTFLDILDNLDNTPISTARIESRDFVKTLGLNFTNNAFDLYTNLIALTAKIDNEIFIASDLIAQPLQIGTAAVASNLLTINVITGNPTNYLEPGSKIMLGGGWTGASSEDLSGPQVVSSVTATTIVINVTAADGAVTLASPTIHSNEYRSIVEPSIPNIPTPNSQLVEMQNYIINISDRLLDEPDAIINPTDKTTISGFDVTTSTTVKLTITIPEGINDNYFLQLYRSPVARATGAGTFDDLVPSDELQLVYEAYPTAAELSASEMVVNDITPDDFRGANLYTNAATGEGILQANDAPPFAKDINRYRNSIFYANTRTVHRMNLNLLGVIQMLADYNLGTIPKVTIANSTGSNTYSFIQGEQHVDTIETVADVANSLNGTYFLLESTENKFYVWYSTGTGVDPAISGRTGIKVNIITNETANNVAEKTRNKLSLYLDDFIITGSTNQVIIRCFEVGEVENASDFDTGFTFTNNFVGQGERVQPQITQVTTVAGSQYLNVGVADSFTIYSTSDAKLYRFWFNRGTVTNPTVLGEFGVEIILDGSETADDVANLIVAAMPTDFTGSANTNIVTITNNVYGYAGSPSENVSDAGFLISVTQPGALEVLLSPLVSPALAVDETAKSFIRVINKNPGEVVYGHYISSVFDIPGKMLIEARTLSNVNPFYIVGNNDNTGLSFNPDIGPEGTFTNTAANPTVITTSFPHGLITGDNILLTSSTSTPRIDGLHSIVYINPYSFSIDRNVSIGGSGSYIKPSNSVFSENEEKINRVYYSKFLQPDAVPISNFFDVGASDKEILRIVPLRDSLFVFKEDGLYRISGESAPFQLELFDNSFITIAPDSVAVANNIIYAWTTQGIQSLSEGGSAIISRQIDDIILKIQSSNYPGFKTATWGIGYESDNAYLVFTVDDMEDEIATICYRYSTLTNTWTTYDISKICGTINQLDDKLYLGASDVPYIEQERKTFSRLDYADRELSNVISADRIIGKDIILPDIAGIAIGDVLVQDQTITTTEFNILLEKLDLDSGTTGTDYLSTLEMTTGDSPRNKLIALAQKLDLDTTVDSTNYESTISTKVGTISATSAGFPAIITTSSPHGLLTGRIVRIDSAIDTSPDITGDYEVTVLSPTEFSIPTRVRVEGTVGNFTTENEDFRDIKTCYNAIIDLLNVDNGVSFTNYKRNKNNTIQESIITNINPISKKVTVNLELQYLIGAVTVFKSIPTSFTYAPVTLGDPLMLKRMAEATIMFESRALTGGKLSFSTDLLPEFIEIPFKLSGNGIFGHSNFGEGFFGGVGNAAPFRTFIPRQCQWCRYMVVKFEHNTARENYHISGMTLTGNIGISPRGYK